MKTCRQVAGFSLVEVIVVVAVVGVVASLSYAVVGDITGSAKKEKLNSDSRTLNRAVMAYLAAGGSLDDAESAEQVLAKLRTEATATLSKRLPGLSSTFMDPRVSIRMQSEKEAGSDDARVYWDSSEKRFRLAFSGDSPGIKEFFLDDKLAESGKVTEDRKHILAYNDKPGWIWDYQDRSFLGPPPGPTAVATVPDTGYSTPMASAPSGGPLSGGVSPTPGADLLPPEFTVPGGKYSIDNYDLTVGVTNPNPPGVSALYFQVNYGDWQIYSGNIPAEPGTVVSAQVVALDPNYKSSAKVDQTYQADPKPLYPPLINPDHDGFAMFLDYDITVTLTNPNDSATSIMRYRVNGGAWQEYIGPFVLAKAAYPAGATVEAQAVSSGSPYYLSSSVVQDAVAAEGLAATGNTSGAFHDPSGPDTMVSSLAPGATSSHFSWGGTPDPTYSQSWMDFAGTHFGLVSDGSRFSIGTLTYYNGTIASGTGADTIDMDISLSLDINGKLYNPKFGFTFNLINTPNVKDDPWGSADYVKLSDPLATRTLVIEDYEYEFQIEFGETTADGFSKFDEFHVLEENDASVNVYGIFNYIGLVDNSNTDPFKGGTEVVTDPDSGTVSDPLYQKDGYVDPLEAVTDLIGFSVKNRDIAKDGRDDAKDGVALAVKAIQDIARKIKEGRYFDASKLAYNATIAETAARSAETAAADVALAKEKAWDLLQENTNWYQKDSLKKQYDYIKALAAEAAGYAAEARAYADSVATEAATVATIWNDFLSSGPTNDPVGFADYLYRVAADARNMAKTAWEDAVDASALALKRAQETAQKIAEKKYYDARRKAAEAAAAAAEAKELARLAESKSAGANAAATQANTIHLANPSNNNILKDALDAAVKAAEASDFAAQARTAANQAAAAAAEAAARIAALPTRP